MAIITVREAAKRLGELKNKDAVHRTYVIQLINQGRLKATKNEAFGYYEIEPDELQRFIKEDFVVSKPRGRNARKIREQTQLNQPSS